MRIGIAEFIVIIIVAIALIKPEKLKPLVKNIAKALRTIREENEKINTDIIEPIKDTMEPVTSAVSDITSSVKGVEQELQNSVNEIKSTVSLNKD